MWFKLLSSKLRQWYGQGFGDVTFLETFSFPTAVPSGPQYPHYGISRFLCLFGLRLNGQVASLLILDKMDAFLLLSLSHLVTDWLTAIGLQLQVQSEGANENESWSSMTRKVSQATRWNCSWQTHLTLWPPWTWHRPPKNWCTGRKQVAWRSCLPCRAGQCHRSEWPRWVWNVAGSPWVDF